MVKDRGNLKYRVKVRTAEPARPEEWYEKICENIPESILILDRHGIIIKASAKIFDYYPVNPSDLIGTSLYSLPFSDREGLSEKINGLGMGESRVFEESLAQTTGSDIYVELSAKVIAVEDEIFIFVWLRNNAEKKRYQEQVFAMQKLDSISTLAGGMVHDFRNLITAVLAYLEILRTASLSKEKIKQKTDLIESKLRRASHMITHLLGFARNDSMAVSGINMNDIVTDSANLFEFVLQKNISIVLSLQDQLPAISGDANQMENMILNILTNAKDAMPDGGLITIKTSLMTDVTHGEKKLPLDRYVAVEISDTGCGIPENIRNRVFEPFFTTKPQGKGTGLGLSMSYHVAKAAKGEIFIESAVGKGTTFKILLPASD